MATEDGRMEFSSADEIDRLPGRVTTLETSMTAVQGEIETARGGYTSLDDRIDVDTAALVEIVDSGAKNKLSLTLAGIQAINTVGSWSGNAYTRRGVTFTVNADMSISVSGANDGSGSAWLDLYGTTSDYLGCVGSGCPEGGSSTTYGIQYGVGATYDYGTSVVISGTTPGGGGIVIRENFDVDAIGGLVFRPMICTKAAWDISHAYVPYCPSMAELYQMILALQNGTRSAPVETRGDLRSSPELTSEVDVTDLI